MCIGGWTGGLVLGWCQPRDKCGQGAGGGLEAGVSLKCHGWRPGVALRGGRGGGGVGGEAQGRAREEEWGARRAGFGKKK